MSPPLNMMCRCDLLHGPNETLFLTCVNYHFSSPFIPHFSVMTSLCHDVHLSPSTPHSICITVSVSMSEMLFHAWVFSMQTYTHICPHTNAYTHMYTITCTQTDLHQMRTCTYTWPDTLVKRICIGLSSSLSSSSRVSLSSPFILLVCVSSLSLSVSVLCLLVLSVFLLDITNIDIKIYGYKKTDTPISNSTCTSPFIYQQIIHVHIQLHLHINLFACVTCLHGFGATCGCSCVHVLAKYFQTHTASPQRERSRSEHGHGCVVVSEGTFCVSMTLRKKQSDAIVSISRTVVHLSLSLESIEKPPPFFASVSRTTSLSFLSQPVHGERKTFACCDSGLPCQRRPSPPGLMHCLAQHIQGNVAAQGHPRKFPVFQEKGHLFA